MNTGDTAFMLIATALVFFMTPGLAFFYGGLVRRKNVCNTMMACVAIMGLVGSALDTVWLFPCHLVATMEVSSEISAGLALNGVGWEAGPYADSIPHLGILCLSDDVCNDYASTYYWFLGRAYEV